MRTETSASLGASTVLSVLFDTDEGTSLAVEWRIPGLPVPKRILIVDDVEAMRKLIRVLIQARTDFEVCGDAVDGVDAIEKAKQLKPDLIVLDLAMPRMNGVEAASVLKSMMPNVRIALCTLYADTLAKSLASAAGIDAVISKTDGIDKLTERVKNLLEPSKPTSQTR